MDMAGDRGRRRKVGAVKRRVLASDVLTGAARRVQYFETHGRCLNTLLISQSL